MKRMISIGSLSLCVGAWFVLFSSQAYATDELDARPSSDESGLTILSNATNVTHWGLGVGVGVVASPYKQYGSKVSPLPMINFDNKWVRLFGTSVELKIAQWGGVGLGLRAQYAIFDGYKASDSAALEGMQKRSGAFWYGPAVEWRTEFGTLSGEYLVSGNKGQRTNIGFGTPFSFGSVSVEPHINVQWLSGKYVNYYYGVRSEESRSGRAAYGGASTINVSFGSRFAYRIGKHQSITLDVGVTRLGGGITDSPLVGKRFVPQVMGGYVYQFK
ncbi:MipA/OmpV family protein [Burkholderia ubonensis]|uniref:MipA/OmpV family protein n=1 Tax=Burkholderia ubonensis TaxID=101571 RepID=UPI000B4FE5C7|nr:MipA/OmpV family protein [Burkholderia ubonensis]